MKSHGQSWSKSNKRNPLIYWCISRDYLPDFARWCCLWWPWAACSVVWSALAGVCTAHRFGLSPFEGWRAVAVWCWMFLHSWWKWCFPFGLESDWSCLDPCCSDRWYPTQWYSAPWYLALLCFSLGRYDHLLGFGPESCTLAPDSLVTNGHPPAKVTLDPGLP